MRNVIGGVEVMAGQLGHLISVASLPSVSLGIIPMGLPRDVMWPVEDFWIFDDAQVNVRWLTLTQPREIAVYGEAFSHLSDIAVHGAKARSIITAAIDGADVLDVGTGSGYGTALLARRLGAQHVTSIDVDDYLTSAATCRLAEAGLDPKDNGTPPSPPSRLADGPRQQASKGKGSGKLPVVQGLPIKDK